MLAPIVEIFVTIAALLLELTVHLVAFILTSSYLAAHTKGLARATSFGALFLSLYLLVALLRGFIPALASPGISVLFSWPAVLVAAILAIVLLSVPFAIAKTEGENSPDTSDISHKKPVPVALTYLLSVLIVFGGLAALSEGTRAPTMEERFCESILSRAGTGVSGKIDAGLERLGSVLSRDFSGVTSCTEIQFKFELGKI